MPDVNYVCYSAEKSLDHVHVLKCWGLPYMDLLNTARV